MYWASEVWASIAKRDFCLAIAMELHTIARTVQYSSWLTGFKARGDFFDKFFFYAIQALSSNAKTQNAKICVSRVIEQKAKEKICIASGFLKYREYICQILLKCACFSWIYLKRSRVFVCCFQWASFLSLPLLFVLCLYFLWCPFRNQYACRPWSSRFAFPELLC